MRENLYASLYHRQLGTLVVIPRGTGTRAKIPRWGTAMKTGGGGVNFVYAVSAGGMSAISARAEGTTVTPTSLSAQFITGDVVQFAGAKSYSDKSVLVVRGNIIEGCLETEVREMAFRLDRYTLNNISASATTRRAGGAAAGAVPGTAVLNGKNIARIAPYMDANNVPRWEDETFVAVTHPLNQFDVFADQSANGFVSVARYGERQKIYKGEVGQMYGVRFLFSNANTRIFGAAGNTATYGLSAGVTGSTTWVFAPDAFYSLELEDGGVEVIHHPPGSGGSTGDPTNVIGSVATKVWYGVAPAPSGDQRLMRFVHATTLR